MFQLLLSIQHMIPLVITTMFQPWTSGFINKTDLLVWGCLRVTKLVFSIDLKLHFCEERSHTSLDITMPNCWFSYHSSDPQRAKVESIYIRYYSIILRYLGVWIFLEKQYAVRCRLLSKNDLALENLIKYPYILMISFVIFIMLPKVIFTCESSYCEFPLCNC